MIGEIEFMRQWFKEHSMHLVTKPKGGHCNLVESVIGQIKRLLYNAMRTLHEPKWSDIIDRIIENLNSTKNEGKKKLYLH